MPELPEVETVVRDLRPRLVGRRLTALTVSRMALRRRWAPAWKKKILGRFVQAIARRGKWITIDLDGPWLLVHLGMSGQFFVTEASVPCAAHTHLVFALDEGAHELRYRDVRRFGSVTLYEDRATLDTFFADSRLGPEPFDLDRDSWRAALQRSGRNLKAILLDQTIVAGVGNIYADESLFEAKLNPHLLGRDLTARQADRLREAIETVLNRAIAKRGSSIRDYVGGSGLRGGYQDEFRAYGRTDSPCLRCQTPIAHTRLAGRSTHYCPACQPQKA